LDGKVKTTRRNFLAGSAALMACPPHLVRGQATPSTFKQELWFSTPANRWMEALPIGNGRIGGMIYGGASVERIDLTESTVWSGAPNSNDVNTTALANLEHIRELMFAGNYTKGGALCKEHLLGRSGSFGTNLPMATLQIDSSDQPTTNYRRSLNLDDAIAYVDYVQGDLHFHREIFSSNSADVLVARLTCDKPKSITGSISFAKFSLPGEVRVEGTDTLVLRGNAYERLHSNGRQGVAFETCVRIVVDGGELQANADRIEVHDVNSILLLVAVATDFCGADPSARCREVLEKAHAKPYSRLRAEHIADHRALFHRTSIHLGSNPSVEDKPTDRRRADVQAGAADPGLAALFFQYGRYLTIAGSRANSPLPLALQGIWNDGLASSMGWTDDFHLDINTQQNYWVAEVGNLPDCQTPVFNFVDNMRIAGRSTAREMYGAPGWVCHVVTNPWGFTAPGWGLGWGIFPTGGLWLAMQLWEHYRFAADKKFLADRVYPVFKEAAEFFLAYMAKHPKHGWLVTGPAVSPENWFIAPDGSHCSESMGPTCDRVLLYALLSATVETTRTLGIDKEFGDRAEAALKLLPPLQIGRYGQLQEWLEDFEEAEPAHRHTSHLLALYPEHQISPDKTPALARAARITIERRISQPTWEDSEWGRANLVNYYARLLDGDAAHKHLVGLLSHATESSLLTYSRGGVAGAESNIFSLDGNTAGAAGIAEMLLQSLPDEIHLLPALPLAWPSGRVSGLCARGAVEVSMVWNSGELVSASFKAKQSGGRRIRYGLKFAHLNLTSGRETTIDLRDLRNAKIGKEGNIS
jgi:alpha-L-fucosidase 2